MASGAIGFPHQVPPQYVPVSTLAVPASPTKKGRRRAADDRSPVVGAALYDPQPGSSPEDKERLIRNVVANHAEKINEAAEALKAAGESIRFLEDKIAAVGVRLRKWVSFHGIAINVNPNLEHYKGIIPCGIQQHGVTSLYDLGLEASMDDLDNALSKTFKNVFRKE